MKFILSFLTRKPFTLILLAFIGFSGCGSSEESDKTERQFLSIGTAPPGGAFFPVGSAIAQAVSNNRGELPWQVSAEATKGTQENIRRLSSGELDFAMANSAISYFAVRGEDGWEKKYSI